MPCLSRFRIYGHRVVMAAMVLLNGCQSAHRLGVHSEEPSGVVQNLDRSSQSFSALDAEFLGNAASDRREQSRETEALLLNKLADPTCALSESESISLLMHCVQKGEENAEQIKDKEAIMVIGNTGSGKSTFLNYLLGCAMTRKDPEELGLTGLADIVIVSPDSALQEMTPIGHRKTSKTFMPQIVQDTQDPSVVYCDCPGFLDNRGPEINIGNSLNIKRVLQSAQGVKVMMLINYHSLMADRGKGLRDTLSIYTQLFGNLESLERHRDSTFLCVTQIPTTMRLSKLRSFLTKDQPAILQKLSDRLLLYDPLDEGGEDFWNRSKTLEALKSLKSIPRQASRTLFHTVLTDSDEIKLIDLVDHQGRRLQDALHSGAYPLAAQYWGDLNQLRLIDHARVQCMLSENASKLRGLLMRHVADFWEDSAYHRLTEAERKLAVLTGVASFLRVEDLLSLELDIPSLQSHLAHFKRRKLEDGWVQPLNSLAVQLSKLEERLVTQGQTFQAEQSRLQLEMVRRDHEERLTALERERASVRLEDESLLSQQVESNQAAKAALQKQLEDINCLEESYQSMPAMAFGAKAWKEYFGVEADEVPLPDDIEAMLDRESAFLLEDEGHPGCVRDNHLLTLIPAKVGGQLEMVRRDHEERLTALERERTSVRLEYESLLSQQVESNQAAKAALQKQLEGINCLEESYQSMPAMAFGAKAWKEYFGVEVDEVPLPHDIEAMLDRKSSFLLEDEKHPGRVRDNHLLTLIPARVNGQPFTLDKLGELILPYFPANNKETMGDNAHGYRYYTGSLTPKVREEPLSSSSYWVLLPKTILSGSRGKSGKAHSTMASKYRSAGYAMPRVLEVATSLLSHYVRSEERFYAANSKGCRTFTRCADRSNCGDGIFVGGFDSSGLFVCIPYFEDLISFDGVSCCRKL